MLKSSTSIRLHGIHSQLSFKPTYLPANLSITQKNPSFKSLSLQPQTSKTHFFFEDAVLPPPPLRSFRSFGFCILRAVQLDHIRSAILSYRNRNRRASQAYLDAASVYWRGGDAYAFRGIGVGGCCCWWNRFGTLFLLGGLGMLANDGIRCFKRALRNMDYASGLRKWCFRSM
jgi:hypothetical protein